MSVPSTCSQCGDALPPGVLAGHCPRCLMATLGLGATAAEGPLPEALRDFGDYELLEEIARGGMGVVYRARQKRLNRIVALKMILAGEFASPEFVRRFQNEAEAAARLRHPNIVTIHEVGEHEGRHFLAMELVEGPGLAELVRDGPLPARRAVEYLKAVSEAVAHAHAQRVLHRDLKPSNILIDPFDQPRVMDFGLARQLDGNSDLTVSGQAIGSPGYMPPEQALGRQSDIGPASDVYALGAVLYHLISGRPPFQGDTVHAVLAQVQTTEPVAPRRLNPSVPADLETICLKCLEKDPARRYAGADELAAELGRFLRDEPILARPPGAVGRLWRWCRRRPAVAALSVSVFLLLLLVAVGSSVAAWRVASARHAESEQRLKAEGANADLRVSNRRLYDSVRLLELRRAETFFKSDDATRGVAHLAAILRRDPSNHIAASRLVSALVHRDWALPATPPLRHLSPVETVSFSPDGTTVLTVCRDSFARLWDAGTGGILAMLRHGDRVLSARFSRAGTRVVTASADGGVRVWRVTDGAALTPFLRHPARVPDVEFSPDGTLVLTACTDKIARLWDAETGRLVRELRGHSQAIRFARFSPDGRLVATAGGTLRVWNAATGEMLFHLDSDRAAPTSIVFSPDGSLLAWTGEGGRARLWNMTNGGPVGPVLMHADYGPVIWQGRFTPDGSRLFTGAQDGSGRLWDAATGRPSGSISQHDGGITHAAFSRDGRVLVTTSADITARLWDVPSGRQLFQPLREEERISQAEFSPDGRRLVTGAHNWMAQVWNIEARQLRGVRLGTRVESYAAVFGPGGEKVFTAWKDRSSGVLDARSGEPLGGLVAHEDVVLCAAFSGNGQRVAAGLANGALVLLDGSDGQVLSTMRAHEGRVRKVQFSPDGTKLLSASADATAKVWDAATLKLLFPPLRHSGEIVTAVFSHAGGWIATASEDNTARVWNAATGAPVTGPLPHLDHVKSVAFSPDDRRVVTASSDNTAGIWEAGTGKLAAPFLRHARIVEQARFSPDGKRIVTSSIDLTARVWDAASGQALTEPLAHESSVTLQSLSADGTRLLTGTWGGMIRVWNLETGLPLTEAVYSGGRVNDLSFDAGSRRAVSASLGGSRLWDFPPAPVPVPSWFPTFVEAVAGLRLSDRGNEELVARQEIEDAAERLQKELASDFYVRVAQWFLASPAQRAASPF